MNTRSFISLPSSLFLAVTLALGPQAGKADDMRARVAAVPDGDTLVLADGSKVRLVGIQAPKLPLGRDFDAWPLAELARQTLVDLALEKDVTLQTGTNGKDRHGRLLARAYLEDGTFLQQAMVGAGMARVYSLPDNRDGIGELLKTEAQARADRRGLWAGQFYAPRNARDLGTLAAREGYFELVEGRVLNAAMAGGLVYLNFGRSWSTDFTVVIARPALKLFAEAGLDPLTLEDHLVRVRGWIELADGPRIEVTHPEQIEALARQ